jgi:hypothetical protein
VREHLAGMPPRQGRGRRMKKSAFLHHAEGTRDLRLALAWVAAALIAGAAANLVAMWFGAGQ